MLIYLYQLGYERKTRINLVQNMLVYVLLVKG